MKESVKLLENRVQNKKDIIHSIKRQVREEFKGYECQLANEYDNKSMDDQSAYRYRKKGIEGYSPEKSQKRKAQQQSVNLNNNSAYRRS